MRFIFGLAGIAALLASLGTCVMSKSAVHETLSGVIALIGVLALGFAAVLEEIQRSRRAIQEQFHYLGEFLSKHLK